MKHQLAAKHLLHQLGIGKMYSGYDYVLYGINLISENEALLNGITKVLYIDIAKKFRTSASCVEKNIRKVIDVIWNDIDGNEQIIQKIFGDRYVLRKPSNKVFLDLLYEYAKYYEVFENIFHTDKITCPLSNEECTVYNEIIQNLINLK